MTPTVVRTAVQLADALTRPAGDVPPVVLVPTMGALHLGHQALLRRAREEAGPAGSVVCSVFVNPLQFGPGEDFERYPRDEAADLATCAAAGVDVVFAPDLAEVYPDGEPQVSIDPGPLGQMLEGDVRPGHFRGVLTVVAKLFGLVRPDVAVFGEKDYQQLVLVRRMSTDLCLGVRVVGEPTVREADGLARSSRNRYLDERHRRTATVLSRALGSGVAVASQGGEAVLEAVRAVATGEPGVQVDYLELTGPDLGPAPVSGPARLLVAARVGPTRLIDNAEVFLGDPGQAEPAT